MVPASIYGLTYDKYWGDTNKRDLNKNYENKPWDKSWGNLMRISAAGLILLGTSQGLMACNPQVPEGAQQFPVNPMNVEYKKDTKEVIKQTFELVKNSNGTRGVELVADVSTNGICELDINNYGSFPIQIENMVVGANQAYIQGQKKMDTIFGKPAGKETEAIIGIEGGYTGTGAQVDGVFVVTCSPENQNPSNGIFVASIGDRQTQVFVMVQIPSTLKAFNSANGIKK